ncbi:hypothetical protein DFH07DRAFT_466373 [Mycena maculata]|uniref:Uncharacterized protein n=1 Tax=Mycena maculata TaxID=230809 RepID=A0AAD7NYA3_9AGAR|nr:hypothetical protein DFH07DRAFT_466373 [Mycena maculata]
MADSELYSRLLFPRRQGYPLFRPQPSDDLPEPVRKIGTEIGDVGVVTEFGCFDPIFNILRVADDPANRFGVPPGFEQASVDPKDIDARVLCHLPGTDISNTTVNKRRLDIDAGIDLNNVFFPLGAGAVVEVSTNSKQTALLLLPDGASRWDLRRKQAFRDYASKHAENWYAFVNGELGRMIGNGDLYLVTGVTKSTSWSVAALENNSGNGNVSLRLKAAQIGTGNASCVWQWESTSSSVDAGPRRRLGEESWRDNQTVFIRGFKVALRSKPKLLWRTPKVVSITNSKESEVFSKSTSVPNPQPRPQSGPSNNLPQNSPNNSDSSSASDSDTSNEYGPHLYHPADVINNYLLDCVPEAMVAVTHDDEWASVLDVAEDEVPEEYELIRRVSKQFDVEASSGIALFAVYRSWAGQLTISRGRGPSSSQYWYRCLRASWSKNISQYDRFIKHVSTEQDTPHARGPSRSKYWYRCLRASWSKNISQYYIKHVSTKKDTPHTQTRKYHASRR